MNTKHRAEFANLQWDDVRLFRAVLRLGSMRKVDSDHGVVVDTIRRRIERIEARLGLTLVHRSANGIVLAEDGEKLLRIVDAMGLAAERDLAASSKDVLVKPRQLTIACAEGIGTLGLTPRMSRLQAVLPEMPIGLDFDYNLERDRTHEADIWLTYQQPTQADRIASKLATFISLCMRTRATFIALACHQRWTRSKIIGLWSMSVLVCARNFSTS